MTRSRSYGILADHEDQYDHHTLCRDPVFKLIAGRTPTNHASSAHASPANAVTFRERHQHSCAETAQGAGGASSPTGELIATL